MSVAAQQARSGYVAAIYLRLAMLLPIRSCALAALLCLAVLAPSVAVAQEALQDSVPSFGSGDDRTESALAMTVPFALDLLNTQGGFAPFGLGIASEGAALIPVHLMDEGVPPPEVAMQTLAVLRQMATEGLPEHITAESPGAVLDAAVVCVDTYVDVPGRGRTEAVLAAVEARGLRAKTYVQPYVREEEGIRYLEPYIAESDPMMFVGR